LEFGRCSPPISHREKSRRPENSRADSTFHLIATDSTFHLTTTDSTFHLTTTDSTVHVGARWRLREGPSAGSWELASHGALSRERANSCEGGERVQALAEAGEA